MVVVVMGVTGSGKTTVGTLLASRLGWIFADADDYHSSANKQKIHDGIALTDEDRAPWLASLRELIVGWTAASESAVLACSALKHSYQQELRVSDVVRLVYLHGSPELIAQRLHERHGHFAGEAILASQFKTLEEPEDAVVVEIEGSPAEIVDRVMAGLDIHAS